MYDSQRNGLLVTWFAKSEETIESVACFLHSFLAAGQKLNPNLQFSCTLTDNDSAKLARIEYSLRLACTPLARTALLDMSTA